MAVAAKVETHGFRSRWSKGRNDGHGDGQVAGGMETEGSRLAAPCVWVGGCLSHGWEDMGGAMSVGHRQAAVCVRLGWRSCPDSLVNR